MEKETAEGEALPAVAPEWEAAASASAEELLRKEE